MSDDLTAEQKRLTHENWVSRGKAWDGLADRMAKLAKGLNEPLIAAAGIQPGHKVLDLASGAGEPALAIAEIVGPEGAVTATDMVPEMLAGARRRAAEAGIANIVFQGADMEALPFDDQSFDAVTCRLGLMYVPRPVQAAAEARRVLKPGGRAAYLVWGPHEDNTQFIVLDRVLEEVMGLDPHEGAFTTTRFGAPGKLAEVLADGGFEQVDLQSLRFSPRVDPAIGFWRPQVALRLGDRLDGLSAAERDRLDTAMAEGFEPYRDGDRIQLQMHTRIGIGIRRGGG